MVGAKKGVMEQDKKVKGERALSVFPLSPLPFPSLHVPFRRLPRRSLYIAASMKVDLLYRHWKLYPGKLLFGGHSSKSVSSRAQMHNVQLPMTK